MKVIKFGGTSVGTADAIRQVEKIVRNAGPGSLTVVSAFSCITNALTRTITLMRQGNAPEALAELDGVEERHRAMIAELGLPAATACFTADTVDRVRGLIPALTALGDVTPRAADTILATGETLSSRIIVDHFALQGLDATHIDAREVLITDASFGAAQPDTALIEEAVRCKLLPLLTRHRAVVAGGYIGATPQGVTTTLGRGGSDYSAALLAAAIGADECQIWTDVDGIMTCDPRIIPAARTVPRLTYDEAAELAFFGAKVLHPLTIFPAVRKGIPVVIRNTFAPDHPGTRVIAQNGNDRRLKAIAFQRGITVLHIRSNRMLGAYGFLAAVFTVFRDHRTPVDLVTTSEVSISVTIDDTAHLDAITVDLMRLGEVSVEQGRAIVSLIGDGMRETAGIGARFFNTLRTVNVGMVSVGASEVNISIVIAERDLEEAVRLIHNEFFDGGAA
ncbi:MAG TPA: lysine-sensitive aspartokinase 3 [bacterium]|nr:lysine-sensitive aspartokinase 3 [bacterium]